MLHRRRRKLLRPVLRAGDEVDAGGVGKGHILFAIGGGVDQGGGASPILIAAVGVEDLGSLGRVGQQARTLATHLVLLRQVSEGEDVGGVEEIHRRVAIARGLGEALVEAAATGAGDVGPNAIEDHFALFISVDALMEKRAQEAAALRRAVADGAFHDLPGYGEAGRAAFQERDEVANGDHAEAADGGVFGGIDELVRLPGLKAGQHLDLIAVQFPLGGGHGGAFAQGAFANGEFEVLGVGHGIGLMIAVGEIHGLGGFVYGELGADKAFDALGDRRIHAQLIGVLGNVPLPAHPRDGELLVHQKSFGKHAGGLATTIDDIEQQRAVAVGRVLGLQDFDIGREFDEPFVIQWGEFEVTNQFVGG